MKWRPIIVAGLVCAAVAGVVLWVLHVRLVGHWLQLHTGTINEPGRITDSGLDSALTLPSSASSARSGPGSTSW